jgi:glutaminyl-tRNA synthetase
MAESARPGNFLTDIIDADLASGRVRPPIVTRFPPEPNGFLHVGHSKSILLNFGLASRYGGRAHLRFDDTNPTTEETEYVESIQADVRWLGGDWGRNLFFASDYFERMYACAERLVKDGKAYVDTQTQEAIREQRGSFERPGVASPYRDRPWQESLDLLRRMRAGEFPDGACVLRARIDMAHPNVVMRDPLLYRIRHAHHHRTGDAWCIYPMYDFAHPLEDAFEGVTHSICTLEFESNRELYDWVLDNTGPWDPRPRQYEFARLALGFTVMSKRKLLQLVNEGRVSGWDDPRMPTIAGMRRRGVTSEALRDFAELIGVAKNNSVVDIGKLEFAIRGDLEQRSPRALAVLDPLRVTLVNWEGPDEEIDLPWWPAEPSRGGSRKVPYGRELLVEREDFAEDPPAGWKRLAPGREVRLAGAHVVRCDEVVRGPGGEVVELRCTLDPASRGGAGKKGLGTLHWVHATRSVAAPVRLYDRLFTVEQPDASGDFLSVLNPDSLAVAARARLEPALREAPAGSHWQFLRTGYFFVDPVDSRPGAPVFNRTMTLKDTWTSRVSTVASGQVAEARRPSRGARDTAPRTEPARAQASVHAERRAATPELAVAHARIAALPGVAPAQADVLAADAATAAWFDAAVQAGAPAGAAARWIVNELRGLAGDRPLDALPLSPAAFAAFVSLVESGRTTSAGAKTLLGSLVEKPGDPAARLAELGLEKVDDRAAVDAAVARVLVAQAAEVARYRGGERKLLGFLLGAAMRETQGKADPGTVRAALLEKLG